MIEKEIGGSYQGLGFNVFDYPAVFWGTEGQYHVLRVTVGDSPVKI
jgi:hypothetical protein